jgi:alpha-N-acetylglucosaminidase
MNHQHLPALFLTILTLTTNARGQQSSQAPIHASIDAARAVIAREMPHLAPQIHLTLVRGPYAGKPDGFRISGNRGDIHVEAATVPTVLFGVNWYLKYVALMDISTNGSQLGHAGIVLPALNTTCSL